MPMYIDLEPAVRHLLLKGVRPLEIAERLAVSESTVYWAMLHSRETYNHIDIIDPSTGDVVRVKAGESVLEAVAKRRYEREIWPLLKQGKNNSEIAKEVGCSRDTVRRARLAFHEQHATT